MASVYAQPAHHRCGGHYNLSEITTDEIVVPTRGSDWYDNGRWLEISPPDWTANSGSALDDMNGAWNDLFSGVARANLMIDVITRRRAAPPTAQTLAELRTLRAWYYYMLHGHVRRRSARDRHGARSRTPRVSRDSVFKFIEAELNAARTDLPVKPMPADYGRLTQGRGQRDPGQPLHERRRLHEGPGLNATG